MTNLWKVLTIISSCKPNYLKNMFFATLYFPCERNHLRFGEFRDPVKISRIISVTIFSMGNHDRRGWVRNNGYAWAWVEGFEMSDLRPQGYYNLPSFKFVSSFLADGAVTGARTRQARER
jgi:hypothetical protein